VVDNNVTGSINIGGNVINNDNTTSALVVRGHIKGDVSDNNILVSIGGLNAGDNKTTGYALYIGEMALADKVSVKGAIKIEGSVSTYGTHYGVYVGNGIRSVNSSVYINATTVDVNLTPIKSTSGSGIYINGNISADGYGVYVGNGISSNDSSVYINTTTNNITNPTLKSTSGSGIYVNGSVISTNSLGINISGSVQGK
jgi:hypothetical protein